MRTPFDRALETQDLIVAAEAFALRHGQPGSPAYRAAWLQARERDRCPEAPRSSPSDPTPLGGASAVLRLAMNRAVLVDGASMGCAQVVDPDDEGLRIVAHSGLPTALLDCLEFVPRTARTSCARALANARAVWISDTARSPMLAGSPVLEAMLDAGSRAVASLPVVSPVGDVIAMINTHHGSPVSWTQGRRLALERLARTTGRILSALAATGGVPRAGCGDMR